MAVSLWTTIPLAYSQTSSPTVDIDQKAYKIFGSVMSPYCPGQLLADCTSSAAEALRDTIRAQLARGRSEADIVEDLLQTFGDDVQAIPAYSGWASLAWLGPVVALLVGLYTIFRWQRPRQSTPPAPVEPVEHNPALKKKLIDDLKNLD
jgi:cytochrome c-type biogenesis protein CcmH